MAIATVNINRSRQDEVGYMGVDITGAVSFGKQDVTRSGAR
jgi:hypothetical protein